MKKDIKKETTSKPMLKMSEKAANLYASSIKVSELEEYKKTIHVGEKLYIPSSMFSYKESAKPYVEAEVKAKYSNVVLTTNGKYCRSINYIDLLLYSKRLEETDVDE